MMNYNMFTVETLAALHSRADGHNFSIPWGWRYHSNKRSCNYWPWVHVKLPSFWPSGSEQVSSWLSA